MANVGEINIEVNVNNKGLTKGIKDSQKKLGGLGKAAQNAGGLLAGAFAGAAIINGIKNAIKSIAQLESSIKRVSLIAGGGEKEFAKLAKTLGSTTVFTANQASGAMTFLAQAGFSVNQILAATPGVLDLAAAAQLDLSRAADITSNILSGFGLAASEVNRVNDILVTTTNSANLSVEQMGESMKVVAPIAKSAGISINEVAGLMGVLGDAGLQGSLAGTALKGSISSLLKPSKEAASVMKSLGVEIIKNEDGSIALSKTLRALKDAGLSTSDAFTIFGERAAAGALVMANASDKADELSKALGSEDGVGAAARQAKEQLDTLSGDFALLSSAWDGLIQSGSALNGIFRTTTQVLTDMLNGYIGVTGQTRKLIDLATEEAKKIGESNKAKQKLVDIQNLVNGGLNQSESSLESYFEALKNVSGGEEAIKQIKEALAAATIEEIATLREAKTAQDELTASELIRNENIIKRIQGTRELTEAIKLQNLAEWGTFEVVKKLTEEQQGQLASFTEGIAIKGVDVVATDKQTTSHQKAAKAAGEAAVQSAVLAAANRDGAKSIVQASLAAALASIIKSSALSAANPILALGLGAAGVAGINALFAAIPEFAAGTPNFSGGLARVNERGGEIMDLPKGTRIIPHGQSKGMAGGGVSIVVNGFVGNEQELAVQIQQVLDNQQNNTNRLI